MKNQRSTLTERYVTALRVHLHNKKKSKSPRNGDRAQGLGRVALSDGLAVRDLARMHEHAMLALAPSEDMTSPRQQRINRISQAAYFFHQALIPLEAAQRATRETNRLLVQRNETLRLHTAELARGNRRFEREITRRQAGEAVIRKGKEQYRMLFLDSQVMQLKLRHLTRQILSAQEEERKEISRELHDEVVQNLVGINVELSALTRAAAVGVVSLKSKIARTQRLVENSVKAVHRFARELRPAVLDDLGLIPALHAYCKNLATRKGISIQLTAFRGVETLPIAERTVLYRVAQEALTNVARHAHATHARVNISENPGVVRMEISDNGRSFHVEKTLIAKNNKRLGLIGMRERIEMIRGTLTIESAPGVGTTVRAEIPFLPGKTIK